MEKEKYIEYHLARYIVSNKDTNLFLNIDTKPYIDDIIRFYNEEDINNFPFILLGEDNKLYTFRDIDKPKQLFGFNLFGKTKQIRVYYFFKRKEN